MPAQDPQSAVRSKRRRIPTWPAVLLWFLAMSPLSFWGLPTSSRDDLLFGGEPAWEAERYGAARAIAERAARQVGADTDVDPLAIDNRIVELTASEADRAAILRRYRLFSRQPDEMITLMALQEMDPHIRVPASQPATNQQDRSPQYRWRLPDLDPKLYQYGGGYIYLIGGLIAASSVAGLITLTSDANVYLSQPELFASFFLVGRFLSLICGALSIVAAMKLARLAGGRAAGWWTFLLVASCPVFITMALEAKPHMPSACMILWAALAGLRFHARGGTRNAIRMGLCAGYAFGLVLTGLVAAAIVPVLAVMHRENRARTRQLCLAVGIAAGVYLITNPYVPFNFAQSAFSPGGNLGNSLSMYTVGRIGNGAWRVAELLFESCGPLTLLIGLFGAVLVWRRYPRETILAAAPALALLLICVAIGAGKPAEYARFLLLTAVMLSIAAGVAIQRAFYLRKRAGWIFVTALAATWVILPGGPIAYLRSFAIDAWSENETRWAAARYISEHAPENDDIGVLQFQEPAPYGTPPIDFAHRTVKLLPARTPSEQELLELPDWVIVCADDAATHDGAWWRAYYHSAARFGADDGQLSRISWANKPVFVYRRNP